MIITPGQLNQRAELYHQLGSLLAVGVPILQALEMIQRNPPARALRQPLAQLQASLDRGMTISEAVQELGSWIPSFDCALLQAGEQSGRLDVCFKLLAAYYRERTQMVRSVISDLLYPAFVLHFAVILFPFIDYFRTNDLGTFLVRSLGVLSLLYFGIFLLIYACQGRRGEMWRTVIERTLHPIPILGSARRELALARLAAALESLINAGVPIIGGWALAAAASGSPALRRAVETWKIPLETGQTPAEMLSACPEFPDLFTNLYHTGEVSGQLDDTLRRLHAYYRDEGSRKLHLVAQWAPRAVYAGVVVFVAYNIFSFYGNYLNQLNQIMNW